MRQGRQVDRTPSVMVTAARRGGVCLATEPRRRAEPCLISQQQQSIRGDRQTPCRRTPAIPFRTRSQCW